MNSEENSEFFSDTETQNDVQDDVKNTAGSSARSESSQADESLSLNSDKDSDVEKNVIESANFQKERFPYKAQIEVFGKLGMSQADDIIYNQLLKVYRWLDNILQKRSNQPIFSKDIRNACITIEQALHEIDRLEKFNRKITEERDSFKDRFQNTEREYSHQLKNCRIEINQISQQVTELKHQKEAAEHKLEELEASRNKLLAETASLKRDTGTHYNATSDRPHHHILTGEYKTLKEQHLDPLATRLFNVMLTTNPEFKQQRKEKTNDIKAIISATVLINGQAIMRGESIGSEQLPPEILNEMQSLLRQKLQLDDISPDTTELLTKAVNSARGKVEYPQPGNWQEKDYVKAGEELINSLDTELDTSLTPELKTEAQEAIKNALQFLERAALAEPPAKFSLEKEGVPFRSDYHEAAKGWDDEGTVIKTIYPVYLVNGEAKVKAVVLTEPSTENNFDSSSLMTVENTSSTTEMQSTSTTDEKEKIRLDAKRESLEKSVQNKWFKSQHILEKSLENEIIEKLSKIDRVEIIEQLENELHEQPLVYRFKEKLDNLVS
ncbi:hypothetical protein [Lyngbya sp. PCC 8106]|uniref:hypothetical protein n=1 Tax=Lyngbya sp. (strain PCC 8106) TaxID=313612 RepID=UPI0000EA8FB8|nr:hypothetical protein [Lyngbya sp. PCC 8106]EAW35067.1 hypothetical protein L8106_27314 [Lyngbya sp. PCC 8106]